MVNTRNRVNELVRLLPQVVLLEPLDAVVVEDRVRYVQLLQAVPEEDLDGGL
jgi:hypothetical protein